MNRVALTLHKLPKVIMTMSQSEVDSLWDEYVEMTLEMSGKKKPKLYEYEREAINNLKERFNDGS